MPAPEELVPPRRARAAALRAVLAVARAARAAAREELERLGEAESRLPARARLGVVGGAVAVVGLDVEPARVGVRGARGGRREPRDRGEARLERLPVAGGERGRRRGGQLVVRHVLDDGDARDGDAVEELDALHDVGEGEPRRRRDDDGGGDVELLA